jgi:hypothetical protein
MFNIFLTSALTIVGGVSVYVAGQIITRFFIDPYHEYRKVVGEIGHTLVYYANVSASSRREDQEEASTALRRNAGLLRITAHAIPAYKIYAKIGLVPGWETVMAASSALIGLSNGVYEAGHDEINRNRTRVITALNLPPLR